MSCAFCQGVLDLKGHIARNEVCPHCNRDLRCCKQCRAYDPKAYNQCREVSASRIIEKERANLCEQFILKGSPLAAGRADRVKEARKALDALFKKK